MRARSGWLTFSSRRTARRPALPALMGALALALGQAACGGSDVAPDTHADGGPGGPHGDDGGVYSGDGGLDPCALPFLGEGRTLISHRVGPRRLATDGQWLYVTVTGAVSQPDGRLLRMPVSGGAVEEVATDLRAPDAVLAQSDAVFVVDGLGLWRIDLPGGARTRVQDALNGAALGASELLPLPDALLYVTGFRRIVRVGRDGGNAQVLHEVPPGAAVRGGALRGTDLYFFVIEGGPEDRGLWRVPVDGSAQATRVQATPGDGLALAVTDVALFWTEASGAVRALPFSGGEPQPLMDGLTSPARLLPVGSALYVKDGAQDAAASFFVARDVCGATREVGPTGTGPGDLLLHEGVLYFTSEDRSGQGYVARLP